MTSYPMECRVAVTHYGHDHGHYAVLSSFTLSWKELIGAFPFRSKTLILEFSRILIIVFLSSVTIHTDFNYRGLFSRSQLSFKQISKSFLLNRSRLCSSTSSFTPHCSWKGPRSWVLRTQKLRDPLVGAQGYKRFPLFKPDVGHDIALDAMPAYRA